MQVKSYSDQKQVSCPRSKTKEWHFLLKSTKMKAMVETEHHWQIFSTPSCRNNRRDLVLWGITLPRASPSATEMLKVGQCLSKKDTASGVPTIQPLLCTPGRETKSQREKVISPMLTQEILRHLYPMGYSRTVSWDNADLTQKRRFVPVNIWNSPAVEWLINFRSISIILPISHTFCCT